MPLFNSTIQGEKIRIIQGGKIGQRLYNEKMEREKYLSVLNLFKNSIKKIYMPDNSFTMAEGVFPVFETLSSSD